VNNYIIISDDKVVIDLKIKEIIKKIKEEDKEIIKMDLTVNTLDDVLEELNTCNFLSNIKVIILYNSLFIEGDSTYDKELKKIEKYLEEKNDNVFIMVAEKKSSKKSITELLSKVNVIEEEISREALVKSNLDGFKMESYTIKYFIELCHNNNEKIINELNKLKAYKYDDPNKYISKDDVDKVVFVEFDDNIFDLVNAITAKNKAKALELYQRLIEKEESVVLIASIASKIRMLYTVKVLRDKKMSNNEMAEMLGVKPGAISISLRDCDNFSSKTLLKLLYELSKIDYKSKTTTNDLDLEFKLFLASI